MIGIEIGKPTYIYFEQIDGKFVQYDQLLVYEDEEYQVYSANEDGLYILSSGLFEFNKLCSALDGKVDTTLVFGKPYIKSYKIPVELIESNIYYSGNEFDTITIPEGNYVNLEFVISSEKNGAENIPYSARTDIFPPMPFFWDKIALYQVSPDTYRLGESVVIEKNNVAAVCIKVIENCGCLVSPAIGQPTIMLGEYYTKAPLILGRGFKKRYWKGMKKK